MTANSQGDHSGQLLSLLDKLSESLAHLPIEQKDQVNATLAKVKKSAADLISSFNEHPQPGEKQKTASEQTALKQSEEKFAKIFHFSPVAMAITHFPDGRFIDTNESHSRVTGFTREDLIGHTVAEFGLYVNPEGRELLIDRLREQGSLRNDELRVRKKSGEIIDCLYSLELIELSGETCVLYTIIDITNMKRSENLSRAGNEINQIIHSTFDFNKIMQGTLSSAAKVLECDTAALSLRKNDRWITSAAYGFSEDIIGMEMDDQQELHAVLAIQTKQPVAVSDAFHDERFNREHLRKWGIRSVLAVPVVLRGEPLGVMFFNYQKSVFEFNEAHIDFAMKLAASLSLALDNSQLYHTLKDEISERKRVLESLRASEARERARASELETLMDAVPAMIWISRDTECQDMIGNLTGYEFLRMGEGANISKTAPEVQLANQHYQMMKDGKAVPTEELPMQIAASTGKPTRDYTFDLVFDDGMTYQLIGNVNPLFDSDGKPAGAIGAFVDITSKLALEKQQLEYRSQLEIHHRLMEQREKDRQLIARDIHDGPVQTLSSTLFNIQLAKEAVSDPQFRIEMEQIGLNVKSAVQELRQVIYELRPPSVLRFGLARAIRFHAEDLMDRTPDLKLVLHLAKDHNRLPELMCLTLYRIYQEAIMNILRHSGATRAWVNLDFSADHLTLQVRDNGKGLPSKEDARGSIENGHYGLAGIRERVEAIAGKFTVHSEAGTGTTLRVVVPLPLIENDEMSIQSD